MSTVPELIREEANGSISFGDYTLAAKTKKDNFEHAGDLYKVKTFGEITKLEKNGLFVYESVPGTAVFDFVEKENGVSFTVECPGSAQITVELAESTEYCIFVNGEQRGLMDTNAGGKLTIGVTSDCEPVQVKIAER